MTLSKSDILDVTLRDGGYLNRWQFTRQQIDAILRLLSTLGLRWVELGFLRTQENSTSLVNGCPVEFLAELDRQFPHMQWVGMLDPAEPDWSRAVQGKLPHLSLLRLTCTAEKLQRALDIADDLHTHSPDLPVSVNLICISSYSQREIRSMLKTIAGRESADVVYFADSRGALRPDEIEPLIAMAKDYLGQPLGFHAHDTLGNAVENSRRALAAGCDRIDTSLNGFGLAGGNTSLGEFLTSTQLAAAGESSHDRIADFCSRDLPLRHPEKAQRKRYASLASKNIDPIWDTELLENFPDDLQQRLEYLPRQDYKTLESVLSGLALLRRAV